jgi:D-alanyl-D-alanine carboxypeptidase/D-alanyl-D-alanine carboxypeptidase (penicillin-binding protein 5/6)
MFWNYEYTKGGKIAMISESLISSITLATKDDRNLLSIILNTSATNNNYLAENKKLFTYGFDQFRRGLLVNKGQVMHVIDIKGQTLNLISSGDVYYTYPLGDDYIKDIKNNFSTNIHSDIEKGDFLGTITYSLEDNTIIEVPLQAERSIYLENGLLSKMLDQVRGNNELYNLVIGLLILEAVLLTFYIIRLFIKAIRLVRKSTRI